MTEAGQSVLTASGPEAEAIVMLSWIMFAGALITVIGVAAAVMLASRGNGSVRAVLSKPAFIFWAGAVFPAVTLTALLVYGLLLTGNRVMAGGDDDLRIEITGEQWWWRIRYLGADGFETANELRIPVGRDVAITLKSADVIHSFWVPALAGKLDMIPGIDNKLRIRADRAGVFRGQCAEYCGGPHALMSFHVVALDAAEFESWRARQLQPASRRGANLFFEVGCHACHALRGTEAIATIGPDLTHVGSRLALAAVTLPNDAPSFARWITGNQHIKPNNRMPEFRTLNDAHLAELAAFLESLQ